MTYSIIGILAAIILLIINRDVLWGSDGKAELRFIVSDTGIGMSEEYLPHLLDAFS